MASTRNLLSSSPTSLKPRLWLHRRKCPPPPTHQEPAPPSPPSPTDTRASFLSSLLNARWPKSEPESPIFGQTTPRALSPFRTHPTARPPSQASVPRSILRADSRAGRSARSLASVKFAERPGVWEYSDEDDEDDGLPPCSPGYTARRSVVAGRPGWYGSREALARELKERVKEREHDSDADSVDTYPPPRERERVHSNESFLKRIIGGSGKAQGRPHPPAKGHGAGEKPTISGPMPLQRAASIRGLQQVHKSHAETIIVKPAILAVPPAQAQKKSGKLRNFWGRYVKVS
ncbi:hypothetical protein FA95DRAFT_1202199 [Auriscalpium vulgare]|uniref:Uncharacterized protein n=1 Tax=Auriscalpium vulgare TaxID=40419 RepID=A0ACB8RUC5_9AGAM|nr:hypothetical protein FA95DRAFT_1202199 [Auriscalpium vulgare]